MKYLHNSIMDLSTSQKRAKISEVAGFQPPVYWVSVAVGLQAHVVFLSFQGKCLSSRTGLQIDCRTAPHLVKPCLPGGPGLLLWSKADFVLEFSPLGPSLAQRWVSVGCGSPGALGRQQDPGELCWFKGLTHIHQCDNRLCPVTVTCVNDIIAQHDRISLKAFYIYWLTQWNAGWGCALLTGERTPRRGRGCCPWLLGELLCCAPSSAATHMGDTRFWGHAVPSCFLSPTESAGFTILSYLCSLG